MSTARGNSGPRTRPQRHQNSTSWDSSKNKTDSKTKMIMNLVVSDHCCPKCSGVIQWKIDYGKYKPLSRPGKCVRCQERRIKQAYHTLCENCTSEGGGLCAKCGESWSKEEDGDEDIEEDT